MKKKTGRWMLICLVALTLLAITAGAVLAQGLVGTKIEYEDGQAVSATSYDMSTGMPVPTQGHIDEQTGQYVPPAGDTAGGADQTGQAAGTPAAKTTYFSGGDYPRYESREYRSRMVTVDEYQTLKWREIWSGPQ